MKTKKFFITTLVVVITSGCFAQGAKTSVTGYIPELQESSLSISLSILSDDEILQETEVITTHTSEGRFKLEFPLKLVKSLSFEIDGSVVSGYRPGAGQLFLVAPGDSLYLEWPALDSKLQDIHVSGRGAVKQNLINKMNLKADSLIRNEWAGLDYSDTKKQVHLILGLLTFYESNLELHKHQVDDSVYDFLRAKLVQTSHYSILDQFLKLDLTNADVIELYEQYYYPHFVSSDFLSSSQGNDRILQVTLERKAMVDFLIKNKSTYAREYKRNKKLMYRVLREAYDSTRVLSKVVAGFITFHGKYTGWDNDLEEITQDYFKRSGKNDPYVKVIEKLRLNLLAIESESMKLLDFELQDTARNIVKLKQFSGKVVVLDFMFNGCGGCAILAPKIEKIEHDLEGKDVVFISISVDRKFALFKKSVGKFSSRNSIHLFTNEEGNDHPLIKELNIVAYPTVVLIDKKGRIVNARSPRSGEELAKEILDLLSRS